MIIGISQPTFLPYCGYISLIDFVDEIIFLMMFNLTKDRGNKEIELGPKKEHI